MGVIKSQTGYNITSSKFDTTGIENPFYETSAIRDTLIEQMKNNIITIGEDKIVMPQKKKELNDPVLLEPRQLHNSLP